jgi:hypothetical protein
MQNPASKTTPSTVVPVSAALQPSMAVAPLAGDEVAPAIADEVAPKSASATKNARTMLISQVSFIFAGRC